MMALDGQFSDIRQMEEITALNEEQWSRES
jgi:hypothetical protein